MQEVKQQTESKHDDVSLNDIVENATGKSVDVPELKTGGEEMNVEINVAEMPENQELIADIPSAMYGAFVKILSFLSSGMGTNDVFFIKNGELNTKKSSGFVYSDMTELFGEKSIEIQDPANAVKLLSLIKGGENVVFLADTNEMQYIVSSMKNDDPDRIVTLPIPDIPVNDRLDRIDTGELLTEINIEIDRIEDILNAAKITDSNYFILNFDSEYNLVSIETSNKKFKENFLKADIEHSYKVFDIMMVAKPEEFKFQVYKNDGDIWIKTLSDVGLVTIEYTEKTDALSDFDAFSL